MSLQDANRVESDLIKDLQSRLAKQGTPLPYLFFGSGMSLRYLGLPNWETLMIEFAKRSGLNPDHELLKAGRRLERVASNIADAFLDTWFKGGKYEKQKVEYSHLHGAEDILKVGVAEFLRERGLLISGTPGVDEAALADELDVLKKVKIDGIITTNYDQLVDQIFPDFPVFIGQSDLLLGKAQFIGEIYKIHGSIAVPESLILTESDYQFIEQQNPYLVAKLLTIFAEHPIIFAGYSLDDKYIESMLIELTRVVGKEKSKQLAQRFYFVKFNSNPGTVPSISDQLTVRNDTLLPMTVIETYSYKWIWEAISGLQRPIPTSLLRGAREQIYKIVRDIESAEEFQEVRAVPFGEGGEEVRYIYGFGIFTEEQIVEINRMGGERDDDFAGAKLRREDIFRDTLELPGPSLGAITVLKSGLPDHIEPGDKEYIPLHKYFYEVGEMENNAEILDDLPEIVFTILDNVPDPYPQTRKSFRTEFGLEKPTVAEIFSTERSDSFKLDSVVMLLEHENFDSNNLSELRDQLVGYFEQGKHAEKGISSVWRRALVAYSTAKWPRLSH